MTPYFMAAADFVVCFREQKGGRRPNLASMHIPLHHVAENDKMNIVKGSKDPTPAEYRVKIEVETDKGRNFTASHMWTALKIQWKCVSGFLLVPWRLGNG